MVKSHFMPFVFDSFLLKKSQIGTRWVKNVHIIKNGFRRKILGQSLSNNKKNTPNFVQKW